MQRFSFKITPYLFLAPAFAVLTVFFFLPFAQTIFLSTQDFSLGIYEPVFVGARNYALLLKSPDFLKTILNTFYFMLLCVPILVVFPLFLAILINSQIKGKTVYKLIIYLPVVVSIVVVAIAFKWLFAPEGLLNYLIGLFGLHSVGWLSDPRVAMVSVAIVTVFRGVGYYMMIYLAALMSIPRELYEAAECDGANAVQKHFAVTIPQILPTIALVTTVSAISALKVFVEIYVMTRGGPLDSTKTIVYYIYERAFENLDLGLASAAAVVLLVIVLVFSCFNIFIFERKKYEL
ncbi:putative chitobiose ABC transport system permease protein [Candidatus Gastranaerophilus sp. (ex Termes propinquus)]|nr:putative chitobiose ABC transport system permease protein [Candidatus Gastranaerophilus sp. (ex Termes propinquus)]